MHNILVFLFPFLLSLLLSTSLVRLLLPVLIKQKLGQHILEIGPAWHKSKEGTPTLGGISFLLAIPFSVLVALAALQETISYEIILCLLYAVSNGMIGLIDDSTKLKNRKNQGLLPWQKLFLQILFSAAFLFLYHTYVKDLSRLSLPFFSLALPLGLFSFFVLVFCSVGLVNCANLTDGVDGLAGSVSFILGIFFLAEGLLQKSTELILLGGATCGGMLGFLFFNWYPARIFMGDTGSLFLGALAVSASFLLDMPLLMLVYSLLFIVEGFSVVLQVLHFKRTGKRLFRMAPLHHHLEQCGWSENKICIVSIFATFLISIPVYIFYLP